MKKQRPAELNQKIKRLKVSRDELKLNNREKSLQNKKLRDRNVEITENRNKWKTHSIDLDRQNENLIQQIQIAKEELESERRRSEEERSRADKLQAEIELIRKKKIKNLKI